MHFTEEQFVDFMKSQNKDIIDHCGCSFTFDECTVTTVDEGRENEYYYNVWEVKHIDGNVQYFRQGGDYDSWSGTSMDSTVEEVKLVNKTIQVWENV